MYTLLGFDPCSMRRLRRDLGNVPAHAAFSAESVGCLYTSALGGPDRAKIGLLPQFSSIFWADGTMNRREAAFYAVYASDFLTDCRIQADDVSTSKIIIRL